MSEISTDERCRAVLKYIHNWRCTRRAVIDGLCLQHRRAGATIPAEWRHERNDHGVLTCEPVSPYEKRPARA